MQACILEANDLGMGINEQTEALFHVLHMLGCDLGLIFNGMNLGCDICQSPGGRVALQRVKDLTDGSLMLLMGLLTGLLQLILDFGHILLEAFFAAQNTYENSIGLGLALGGFQRTDVTDRIEYVVDIAVFANNARFAAKNPTVYLETFRQLAQGHAAGHDVFEDLIHAKGVMLSSPFVHPEGLDNGQPTQLFLAEKGLAGFGRFIIDDKVAIDHEETEGHVIQDGLDRFGACLDLLLQILRIFLQFLITDFHDFTLAAVLFVPLPGFFHLAMDDRLSPGIVELDHFMFQNANSLLGGFRFLLPGG
jgi:hypothetical protein